MRAELAAGKLSFFLCGEKLKGSYALVRTRQAQQWLLIKHKDRFAQQNDLLAQHLSVLSQCEPRRSGGAAVEHPPRGGAPGAAPGPAEQLPRQLKPMLAESGAAGAV